MPRKTTIPAVDSGMNPTINAHSGSTSQQTTSSAVASDSTVGASSSTGLQLPVGTNATAVMEIRSPKSVAVIPSDKKERKSTGGNAVGVEGTASNAAKEKDKEKEGKEGKKSKEKDDLGIDDLLLPRTLISRLARGSLPPNTSLQKDALLALTKSATVFISYLAHTANSLTSRKTIQADDVLKAISDIDFDPIMKDRLEREIKFFDEGVRGKRKGYRDRVKARESGVSQPGDDRDVEGMEDEPVDHVSKRLKRGSGEQDIEMGGTDGSRPPSNTIAGRKGSENNTNDDIGNDDDEDDPSAQLLAEASRAANHDDVDQTESEADVVDEEDEDEDDQEEDEEEDDDDDEEEENDNDDDDEDEAQVDKQGRAEDEDDDMNEEIIQRRKDRRHLAPDGRAEVDGSDVDSD